MPARLFNTLTLRYSKRPAHDLSALFFQPLLTQLPRRMVCSETQGIAPVLYRYPLTQRTGAIGEVPLLSVLGNWVAAI